MSDPLWSEVFSLCHFDGVNGSTVITDEKGNGWTCSNSAALSNTQAEAGTASLGTTEGTSDSLQSDLAASSWKFLHDGTIDYTLELSVWVSAVTQEVYLDTGGGSSVQEGVFLWAQAGGVLKYTIARGVNTTSALDITSSGGALTANAWNKIRLVIKPAGTCTMLVNGAVVGSNTFGNTPGTSDPFSTLWIGGCSYLTGTWFVTGFFDELRVSKVALQDTAYTPTVPFPDSDGPAPGGPTEPPVISTQPQNQRVASGATATFTVVATGEDPLTYQWYENDVLMAGETAASLSFTTDNADHGNWYHVVVTGDNAMSTTSANANLAIEQTLSIVTQPQDITARGQDPWQFTVEATGTNLTYQWHTASDNQPIAGETGSSYSGTAFGLLNGYQVYVIVTDDSGSIQSNTVTLTVLPALQTTRAYLWYPDGFPCPSIQYGENVIGFTQQTQFDSGWMRLRRNYLDFIRDASFSFNMSTFTFAVWMDWAEMEAFRDWWYIVVDDETYRCRFSSPISWTYDSFDRITVNVTAEVADYNADVSRQSPTA